MIGWYVHHHGSGHLHRALATATVLATRGEPVTGLSTLPRPDGWPGPWVRLDRDDDGPTPEPTAGGRLHWAPLDHQGLSRRMTAVSGWLTDARPRLVVVDVSVEVAVLVRLHGTPVAVMALPGRRGDAAHLLGYELADLVIGAWPATATGMLLDVPATVLDRLKPVGGLSRFPVREHAERRPGPPRVALLMGTGGSAVTEAQVRRAREQTPGWEWQVLDGSPGSWVADPSRIVADADVVITHAGQNALAEVAAARRPAVVAPQDRPFEEQHTTARALAAGGWPVTVVDPLPEHGWAELLERTARLGGTGWRGWCDGLAATRLAELLLRPGGAIEPAAPADAAGAAGAADAAGAA